MQKPLLNTTRLEKLPQNRIALIRFLCKGKSVLDLGCIDHYAICEKHSNWLHKHIKDVAKSVIGIDYLKDLCSELSKKGYDIRYGDVEHLDLGRTFDCIVAGELIEHVYNAGLFLDSVKKHMHKNSIVIVTTPNAFSIRRILGSVLVGTLRENPEHTAYYSDTTIKQLLARKGMRVVAQLYLPSQDCRWYRKLIENALYLFTRKQNRHTLFTVAVKE